MTIFEASSKGNIDEMKRLLKEGVDINSKNKFYGGWTPLFFASREGHFDLVVFLLEQGAELNIVSQTGWTAFMCACSKGHFKIAKLLLKQGANPTDKTLMDLSALRIALASEKPQTALLFQKCFHLLEEEDKMILRKQIYRYSLIS